MSNRIVIRAEISELELEMVKEEILASLTKSELNLMITPIGSPPMSVRFFLKSNPVQFVGVSDMEFQFITVTHDITFLLKQESSPFAVQTRVAWDPVKNKYC